MKILFLIIAAVAAVIVLISWMLYRFTFATGEKERGEVHIPSHGPYGILYDTMVSYSTHVQNAPFTYVHTQSMDGLKLSGMYYHRKAGVPLILAFHGYKGHPYFDGCPAFAIAEKMGYNLLLVEQRGHGHSEGKCLTMGVRERMDCVCWSRWAQQHYPDTDQVLMGVSIGAATVLMASDQGVSDHVKAIIADCGYTTVPAILKHCIPQMLKGAPVGLCYAIGRLGARLFAGFDPEDGNALTSMKNNTIPVLLIHGDIDDFVPWQMSIENNEACIAEHRLVMIHDAPHAASFFTDADTYLDEACTFLHHYL